MRKKRTYFKLILVIVIGLGGFLIWKNKNVTPTNPINIAIQAEEKFSKETLVMKNIILSQGGKGQKYWTLRAKVATYSKDKNIINLQLPNATYFGTTNESINVTADNGTILQKEQLLILTHNVIGVRANQTVLADNCNYNSKTRFVEFTGNVKAFQPGMTIQADKIVINIDNSTMQASGNVRNYLNSSQTN